MPALELYQYFPRFSFAYVEADRVSFYSPNFPIPAIGTKCKIIALPGHNLSFNTEQEFYVNSGGLQDLYLRRVLDGGQPGFGAGVFTNAFCFIAFEPYSYGDKCDRIPVLHKVNNLVCGASILPQYPYGKSIPKDLAVSASTIDPIRLLPSPPPLPSQIKLGETFENVTGTMEPAIEQIHYFGSE